MRPIIAPIITNGEPTCSGEACPAFEEIANGTGRCKRVWRERDVDMWEGLDCFPGLRQQRDDALARVEQVLELRRQENTTRRAFEEADERKMTELRNEVTRWQQSHEGQVRNTLAFSKECDEARRALAWCLEGFEGEHFEAFYESPLYKKIQGLLGEELIRKIQATAAKEED
jgi:hypothetical protein